MTNQLQKFTKLPHQIDSLESLPKHFDSLCKQGEAFCKDHHQAGIISDQILFHTTGLKFKNQMYQRITENLAKYFVCKDPAFSYPSFKTQIKGRRYSTATVFDIPIRLLQSAGQIATSRFTAMI